MSPSSQNVGETVSHESMANVPAWKQELNQRLAATRSRRLHKAAQQVPLPGLEHISQKVDSRASRLAAKVAQRYANAPSYSEVLAAEVRSRTQAATNLVPADEEHPLPQAATEIPLPAAWSGSLNDDSNGFLKNSGDGEFDADRISETGQVELPQSCAEEITFAEVEPLAVNVIEIPRELVAARKMRPRLAEGPLRAAADASADRSQFKIFEVASETVSQTVSIGSSALDWSPIRLGAPAVATPDPGTSLSQQVPFKTASLEDRLMAGVFDLALIVAAFALFILVFVACTAHPPTGKPALFAAGVVLVGFCLLYQYLFFRFAQGTPGMRYARIALCTFDDDNPTRKAMCRRVLFVLLSAAPLGLGFIWALVDADRLSWHDRLSRIYQRSYS